MLAEHRLSIGDPLPRVRAALPAGLRCAGVYSILGAPTKTVNDASFQSDVIDASQRNPVVVCFATKWSHPSQSAVASLEQMELSYAGRTTFVTMDFDENQHTVDRYGVSVMPDFMVFANSQPCDGRSGVYTDTIRERLDQVIPRSSNTPSDADDHPQRR